MESTGKSDTKTIQFFKLWPPWNHCRWNKKLIWVFGGYQEGRSMAVHTSLLFIHSVSFPRPNSLLGQTLERSPALEFLLLWIITVLWRIRYFNFSDVIFLPMHLTEMYHRVIEATWVMDLHSSMALSLHLSPLLLHLLPPSNGSIWTKQKWSYKYISSCW